MKLAVCAGILALAVASPASAASLNKVLVIGTDGTRWDLVQKQVKAGKAPYMKRLAAGGFGRPSLLRYGPNTLTLSEVGWSSIASGVWDDKHGVDGHLLNMDPKQATKNGYLDFLTRVERSRPSLNTFLASDWDNIGLPLNGGPIFGSAVDVKVTPRVPAETIDNWDHADAQVTKAAARYLGNEDPDVSFVYLGLVDETAHLAGSETPTYSNAIATTDERIGDLVDAIRLRQSFPFESWTIIVVTDHGQRPLSEPSLVSHFGKTKLELTSFLIGSGPGLDTRVKKPLVVDVLPTVLHQVGLRVPRRWHIDGHTLSHRKPPSSATARLRGHRLTVRIRFTVHQHVGGASFRLPARAGGPPTVRFNGRKVLARASGRRVGAGLPPLPPRSLSLTVNTKGKRLGDSVRVTLAAAGTLEIPLR